MRSDYDTQHVRRYVSRLSPLLVAPSIVALALYTYDLTFYGIILYTVAVFFLVMSLGVATELPDQQRDRFWWGRVGGTSMLPPPFPRLPRACRCSDRQSEDSSCVWVFDREP